MNQRPTPPPPPPPKGTASRRTARPGPEFIGRPEPSGKPWRKWTLPLVSLFAVLVIGGILHRKMRNDIWTYYTDGEGIEVWAKEKKERMVLWEDPQQHIFEQPPHADPRFAQQFNQSSQRVEAAFSPDGTLMVLTRWSRSRRATQPDADLYVSSWDGRLWSQPKPIAELNTQSNERGAAFSRDGKYLYFSSDRPGGAGGYDLYVARSDGRQWVAVASLGRSVNSLRNETGPAPSSDGKSLYFSSDRNANDDSQDIFVAQMQGGSPRGNPRGAPPVPQFRNAQLVDDLNSPADDIEAALTGRGSYVFLASDRNRDSRSGFHLYLSRVIDGEIQPPQMVDVYVRSGNATDPAVRMEGFDLLFSADGDLASDRRDVAEDLAASDSGYRLYRSTTREVIGYTDLSRWELFKELVHKIQWLILLAILSLICLIYLLEKWRDITSLFHKCLAGSVGVHLLLLMFMMFWLISQVIEEEEEQPVADVAISVDALAQEELAMESEQDLAEVADPTEMVVEKTVQEFEEANFEPQQIVDNSIPEVEQNVEESLLSDFKQPEPIEAVDSEPLPPAEQAAQLPELTPVELPVTEAESMEVAEAPSENAPQQVDPTRDDFQSENVAVQQVESQKANVQQATSSQLDVQSDSQSVAQTEVSEAVDASGGFVQPTDGLEALGPPPELGGSIAPVELAMLPVEAMEAAEVPSDSAANPVDSSSDDFQHDEGAIQQVESQKADVAGTASSQLDVESESGSVASSNASTDALEAADGVVSPTQGLEALGPPVELAGSIAPAALADVAIEAMELAEVPSDNASSPVDSTQDDFQRDEGAIQQVQSEKADVAGTASAPSMEVQSESGSVASSNPSTEAIEAAGGMVQPTQGLEALGPPAELVGSIAPAELSDVAMETMELAEVPSDNASATVDPTRDDFQRDEGVIQQVQSEKANVGEAMSAELAVQPESTSVADSGGMPKTLNTQADPIQPIAGLSAVGPPPEFPAGGELSDLAADLPGGQALDLPAEGALEAPEKLDVGALGKYIKQQRGKLSDEMVEQLGGSTGTERAIGLGLDWFTDHQENDGHWEMSKYQGNADDNIAGAGLALLCYYGWGIKHGRYSDQPEHDRHSRAVTKAVDWLIKQQDADGSLLGSTSNHGMYCHGIASVALCEGYGLTKDPKLKGPATKAIDYILKAQHQKGGWRYHPGEPGDLSVTGWQYLALHSARLADIPVPQDAFAKTGRFLDSLAGGTHGGYYGYMVPEKNKPTMTATGMFLRQLDRTSPTEPNMQESAQVLKSKMLRADSVDFYFDYYATLALYQHQGPIWNEWNENLKEIYIALQVTTGPDKGSWDTKGGFVNTAGRVVSTGLAILSLEVYYRLLPMYGYDRNE